MKPGELVDACVKAINQKSLVRGGTPLPPCIIIRMPPAKGEPVRRKLVPKGRTPMGVVLQRMEDYDTVSFDAIDVLAYLAANEIVDVTFIDSNEGGTDESRKESQGD